MATKPCKTVQKAFPHHTGRKSVFTHILYIKQRLFTRVYTQRIRFGFPGQKRVADEAPALHYPRPHKFVII